ncbi:hypothetical protein [Pelagerythrobacter sp.]|uniref:hypothetical protein n=1 Tax=Pelagerythrobacter sp. TaxID=2800702 RepID=UPI0035AD9477
MRHIRPIAVAASCIALACCAQPAPEPTPPPPTPAPTPTPTPPPPVAQPQYDNWADAPATPGDWHLRETGSGPQAVFGPSAGEATFAFTCNRADRTVTLMRAGAAAGASSLVVRTETRDGTLPARTAGATLAASLPAADPLLAAMAFSKGRFAVETAGLPTLYIPSWPEMTRVIEDCR